VSWSSQRWDTIWTAVKDIMLTGTGMILIISQVWSRTPSDILLVTGLALTVPSVAGHAKVLLSGSPASPSSQSSPPSGPSPSISSSGADDE
jgi:hypothetical protein